MLYTFLIIFFICSCERCKTRGVRLVKVTKVNKDGTVQIGKGCGIRFPQLGSESTPRLNAEWEKYERSSSPPTVDKKGKKVRNCMTPYISKCI